MIYNSSFLNNNKKKTYDFTGLELLHNIGLGELQPFL